MKKCILSIIFIQLSILGYSQNTSELLELIDDIFNSSKQDLANLNFQYNNTENKYFMVKYGQSWTEHSEIHIYLNGNSVRQVKLISGMHPNDYVSGFNELVQELQYSGCSIINRNLIKRELNATKGRLKLKVYFQDFSTKVQDYLLLVMEFSK